MNATAAMAPPAASRAAWMNARSERDFSAAESIGRALLARQPADERIRRYTARLLEALNRSTEADVHWTLLRDADANDFEAAFHVAHAAVRRGISPEAAAAEAAPAANDVFRTAIVDSLADPPPVLEGDFRHIAISGVAYSGTTLLDRILGGLPEVKSTGESHWITKVRGETGYCEMTLSEPVETARFVPCTVCGRTCQVLTPDFRRSMAADNGDWYRKIAARVGTRILVSADKNIPKLTDKDPLLDLSALVMFKSPEQAWRSQLDKLAADETDDYYQAECSRYLQVWTKNYTSYLEHFRPQGAVVFLNFDAFARDPEFLLRAVCARLDLPFDAQVLRRTVPGHAIGGNGRAMRKLRDRDYAVDITRLPDPELEPVQAEMIASSAAVQAVWRELMARHDGIASGV